MFIRATTTTLAALIGAALALAAPAFASAPSATTGAASAITYQSATLGGTVDPHGTATDWYFQYGTTTSYGFQTAPVSAGSGNSNVTVSAPTSGLAAATTYHYRLVAVGSAAVVGSDKKFTTAKIPLSLSIAAAPNPVSYGAPLQIEGTLSGTGNGARAVVLEANPFPYTPLAPSGLPDFVQVGNPLLTNANGTFVFTLATAPPVTTQYRVVTMGTPTIDSPAVTASVALDVGVTVRRSHASHGFLAHFSGLVIPAQDGARVGIERLTRRGWKAVGGALAHHDSATDSSYTRTLHVTGGGGFYRVIVLPLDSGALTRGYSNAVLVRTLR